MPTILGFVLASCLAACADEELAPTTWPPADFHVVVEERSPSGFDGQRRVEVAADGVLVYATAATVLRAPDGAFALPAYDRLSVCRLVPECTRALSRKLDQLGIRSLRQRSAEGGGAALPALLLRWRGFAAEVAVETMGTPDSAVAAVLRELDRYLPPGEPVLGGAARVAAADAVLSGVPAPIVDPQQAAAFWRSRTGAEADDDRPTLLAFAVACAGRDRPLAEALLQQWRDLAARRLATGRAASAEPAVTAEGLQQLLPPAPAGG